MTAVEDVAAQLADRRAAVDAIRAKIKSLPTVAASKEAQAVAEADLADKDEEIEVAQRSLQQLQTDHESRVYRLAARVHRLENFCTRSENWIEGTLAKDVDVEIRAEQHRCENDVAGTIKEMQKRILAEINAVEVLRTRVRGTAQELRRGHQNDATSVVKGFGAEASAQRKAMERNISPRKVVEGPQDKDTVRIIEHNDDAGGELTTLSSKLKKLTHEKSEMGAEFIRLRNRLQREEAKARSEIKQGELRVAREGRVVQDLHATNGALVSTLQMLMGQLNMEYYGVHGGPTSMARDAARNVQAAITNRSNSPSPKSS